MTDLGARRSLLRTRFRVTRDAGAVVAIGLGSIALLLFSAGGREPEPHNAGLQPAAARVVTSRDGVLAAATAAGHPVYWIPRLAHARLDVTQNITGIYIRYPGPGFLTVATHVIRDPMRLLRAEAAKPGAQVLRLRDGGFAVAKKARATTVTFAYPQSRIVGQVYDRDPGRAVRLVTSGEVRPVEVPGRGPV